jgi:hypothetical protein
MASASARELLLLLTLNDHVHHPRWNIIRLKGASKPGDVRRSMVNVVI